MLQVGLCTAAFLRSGPCVTETGHKDVLETGLHAAALLQILLVTRS